MKLLVISDSHSFTLSSLDFKKYDAVLHCGDYGGSLSALQEAKAYYVKGNCDFYGEESLFLTLFGRKVYITHGHHENVKYGVQRLVYRALEKQAEICLCLL